MQFSLAGDTFTVRGSELTEGVHYHLAEYPEGLTPNLTVNVEGTEAILTFSGVAASHGAEENLDNIAVTFTTDALVNHFESITSTTEKGIMFNYYPTPVLLFPFKDLTRYRNDGPVDYQLSYFIEEPSSQTTTYTITSSDESVVQVGVADGTMTVSPADAGIAQITIETTTTNGAPETFTLNVTVKAPELVYGENTQLLHEAVLTEAGKVMVSSTGSLSTMIPDGTKYYKSFVHGGIFQTEFLAPFDISNGTVTPSVAEFSRSVPSDNTDYLWFISDDEIDSGYSGNFQFNADGTKVFIHNTYINEILQYPLSIPYNVRLAGSIAPERAQMEGETLYDFRLYDQGTRLFVYNYDAITIDEYALTEAFNPSAGITKTASHALPEERAEIYTYSFNRTGTRLFITEYEEAIYTITTYESTIPFDLSSGLTKVSTVSLPEENGEPLDIFFNPEGTRLFVQGDQVSAFDVYLVQYNLDGALSGGFTETAANIGEVEGEILLSLYGDTFTNTGGTLTEGTHFTLNNLPEGLEPVIYVDASGRQATLKLEGNAIDHDVTNTIADLQITFTDPAFYSGNASVFTNAVEASTGFGVKFTASPKPTITAEFNDSTVYLGADGLKYSLSDYYTSSETVSYAASASDTLVAKVTINGDTLLIEPKLVGQTEITVTATGETNGTATQTFVLKIIRPSLAFSGDGFAETTDNNGAVEGSMLISIFGDTFVNAEDTLQAGTHFTVDNLSEGLVPVVIVNTEGSQATLTLEGQATQHDTIDYIADLQFTFTDATFAANTAVNFSNAVAVSTGISINFTPEVSTPVKRLKTSPSSYRVKAETRFSYH